MNKKTIENFSIIPLYFVGHGRVILFFIINVMLLYSVADALASLNSISTTKIYGSLILGSLFGISFPIIRSKNRNKKDFESDLLNFVIIFGIIFIQGFVLIDAVVLFMETGSTNGNLKYAIFNIVVGVIADFAVGSEFSAHVRRDMDDLEAKEKDSKKKVEATLEKKEDTPTTTRETTTRSLIIPPKTAS